MTLYKSIKSCPTVSLQLNKVSLYSILLCQILTLDDIEQTFKVIETLCKFPLFSLSLSLPLVAQIRLCCPGGQSRSILPLNRAYVTMLVACCNCVSILHRFRDMITCFT